PSLDFGAFFGTEAAKVPEEARGNSGEGSDKGSGNNDGSGNFFGTVPKPGNGGGNSGNGDSGNGDSGNFGSFGGDMFDFFEQYYTQAEENRLTGSSLEKTKSDKNVVIDPKSSKGLDELSYTEIYDNLIDSVVGIRSYTENSLGYSWGTGIIFDSDGYIITNEHVIDGCSSAEIVLNNGDVYPALLIGEDTKADVAVLKIDAKGLKAVSFGDSDELKVGQDICVIGNPLGEELFGTLTNGIISSLNRSISENGTTNFLIQATAPINEGNSGGPLIDRYGRVVGMSVMRFADSRESISIDGIGLFIPAKTLAFVGNSLIKNGVVTGRPALGITVGAIPDTAKQQSNLPDGLYVNEVSASCDAAAKGIAKGDVITHVNGQPVTTTNDVLRIREGYYAGDTMTLTIYRDGKTFDVDTVLADQNDVY
ncbi:MAG: S1C family serine protease, partial [Clostridia bacterium]|nr:S1C family serine protease [Clostridia bacterium]